MIELPPDFRARFRPAIPHEIRSWSFGALNATRPPGAEPKQHDRHTLSDQCIFGPLRNFECACGKFRGSQYGNMICDRCGVKITTIDVRRQRFGHIELPVTLRHPLGESSDALDAFPVVPAAFFESAAGGPLADEYDALITACSRRDVVAIDQGVNRIVGLLLPIVLESHRWSLGDAPVLARGIGLELREPRGDGDRLCETCGYPLTGLTVDKCPGCGRPLSG